MGVSFEGQEEKGSSRRQPQVSWRDARVPWNDVHTFAHNRGDSSLGLSIKDVNSTRNGDFLEKSELLSTRDVKTRASSRPTSSSTRSSSKKLSGSKSKKNSFAMGGLSRFRSASRRSSKTILLWDEHSRQKQNAAISNLPPPLTEALIERMEASENKTEIEATCRRLEEAMVKSQARQRKLEQQQNQHHHDDDDKSVLSASSQMTSRTAASTASNFNQEGLKPSDETRKFIYWEIRLQNHLLKLLEQKEAKASTPSKKGRAAATAVSAATLAAWANEKTLIHRRLARLWALYGDNDDRSDDHLAQALQGGDMISVEERYKTLRLKARLLERDGRDFNGALKALKECQGLLEKEKDSALRYHHEQSSIKVEKASIYTEQEKLWPAVQVLEECAKTNLPHLKNEHRGLDTADDEAVKKAKIEDDTIRATVLGKLGVNLLHQGQPQKATVFLTKALELSWDLYNETNSVKSRKMAQGLFKALAQATAEANEEEETSARAALKPMPKFWWVPMWQRKVNLVQDTGARSRAGLEEDCFCQIA